MPDRAPDEFIGYFEAVARAAKLLDVSEEFAGGWIEQAVTRAEIDRRSPFGELRYTDLFRQDFETWLTHFAGSTEANGKGNGKHKGGRPSGYDYEGALIELARFLYNEKTTAEITEEFLFQHARDWLRAKPDDGPVDLRQLKDRVHRFYETVIKDGET